MKKSKVSRPIEQFDISVVIPAYNAEMTVKNTIESVLHQTMQVTEIIVVDDGSTDKTAEVVAEFKGSVTLLQQENKGVSAARNHGIAYAKTSWIAFLDADDLWAETKIESQVNFLRQHPKVNWCATRYYQCLGDDKRISRYSKPISRNSHLPGEVIHSLKSIASQENIWVSTILIRKSLVFKAGGFHPRLSSTADNDLWFRVGKIENQIAFINQPLALYIIDPHGMSRKETKKISPGRFEFFERLAQHIVDSKPEEQSIFERIFDRFAGQYMFNLARTGNYGASRDLLRWLKKEGFRLPGWRYRWIHLIPISLLNSLQKQRHTKRSAKRTR